MRRKVAPISSIGAFAFMLVFAVLFVASMISAVKAPVDELDTVAFDKNKKK